MPFLPKHDFDIFVSYAHAEARDWVDRYCEQLLAELQSLLPGRDKPNLFLDKHDLRAGDSVDAVIRDGLHRSALFLAFISPQYLASPPCMRGELEGFQNLYGPASDRIFQVIRFPIPGRPPVAELLWVQAEERKLLVESMASRLIRLRKESSQLYIAWPGPSGNADRTRIEKEFKDQRFVVRPNIAFNNHAREGNIRQELRESDISIHIFSTDPDPLADRQFAIAQEFSKPALVVTRNPEEPRRHHKDSSPAVYFPASNAMTHLIARVNEHSGPQKGNNNPPAGQEKRFALLYNPDLDWQYADDLTQMLRACGADVIPPSDPYRDPFLHLEEHLEDIRQSAGVVICWGNATEEWLDGLDKRLSALRTRDKEIGRLAKAKYFIEPPLKRSAKPNEFVIRRKEDIPAFLQS